MKWSPGPILQRKPTGRYPIQPTHTTAKGLVVSTLRLHTGTTGTNRNSRLLVVHCEADEIPVVRGPVPVPRYDDAVLRGGGGGETENVAFTWNTKAHP